ncbi:condensation domain-containing protein, partial [Streptomyces sp. NPDC058985]|uniref:condensation domain-containing protein n=1 Tax=Streptomyces sp. NPDC058985 TaxID=3346684 RepID=UPI0036BFFBB4
MAGQLGIWNAQQLSPGNPIYNIAECVEIRGELRLDLFVDALRRTVEEVGTYWLRFHTEEGKPPFQYLDRERTYPVHVIDLSDTEDSEAAAEQWMCDDVRRPADPINGPLFVETVFKLGPAHFIWYQRAHHLVLDAYSGMLIAGRLEQIYASLLEGRELDATTLEPVSVLMDAERAYRDSEDFDLDRRFWLDALADLPELPDHSRPGNPGFRELPGAPIRHTEEIGADAAADLRSAARRMRTSLAGLMVAAAAVYQHRTTGTRDAVIAVPVLGRTGKRELRIPGMMANLLPVRITIDPDTSVEDVVRQTSKRVREGLRHQRYRYEDMHRDLHMVGGAPLSGLYVNVMSFAYPLTFGDCVMSLRNIAPGPIDDLGIDVYDRSGNGALQIAVGANPALHDATVLTDFSRRFQRVLTWFTTAEPTDAVGQAELLSEAERDRVLVEWNDTAVEVPRVSVAGLFEAQVVRSPGAVAVVADGGVEVSYGELDVRANRLARLLV